MIAAFLASRLFGPVASVVAVLCLFLAVGQCSGRVKAERTAADAVEAATKAQKKLAACQANEAILRENNALLEYKIREQSEAVDALKREGDARVAESRKAASQARAVAESYRKEAERILSETAKGPDLCVEADRVLRGR